VHGPGRNLTDVSDAPTRTPEAAGLDLETAGVADVAAAMAAGALSSEALVAGYLARIDALDRRGPAVNAIRVLAADTLDRAGELDAERRAGRVRGPLHGVPVLVKDNIDVAGLPTTGGALALEHSVPDRDADLVARLREAGAVVLGKTNLTELANFMAEQMPSGYSSLGGQVLNPYDVSLTPCGSSSGSGAAAALGLATLTIGTETDGSIICPSGAQSLVGLKPTLGAVPGRGILPISSSQDCAGPMCRTVEDAAALFAALTGGTSQLATNAQPRSLADVRVAVPETSEPLDPSDQELYDAALQVLRDLGATTVTVPALAETEETVVLHYEFARDVDAYLAALPDGAPVRTLAELARWNEEHARAALKYGQAHVLTAIAIDHEADRVSYEAARARDRAVAGEHGIDATLRATGATAIVTPSWHGAGIAARAGYPSLIVPAGYRRSGRKPFGVTFLGGSGTEWLLLGLGFAYEQAAKARRPVSEINPSLLRGLLS
jgi:amidase